LLILPVLMYRKIKLDSKVPKSFKQQFHYIDYLSLYAL
jgi:hypothetical protein